VNHWVKLEKHPNIVRCYILKTVDHLPFMFLEWIAGDKTKGTSLREWLRHGPLELRQSMEIVIDICRGLIHAEQKRPGFVHRDLKPGNILMTPDGTAKITDFGLATVMQESGVESLESGDGSLESGVRGQESGVRNLTIVTKHGAAVRHHTCRWSSGKVARWIAEPTSTR